MTATAVVAGVVFTWLGMVLAISFLEAPLKFRAPDVTLRIGLGISRIVFRALNVVEAALASVLVIAAALGPVPGRVVTWALGAVAIPAIQLLVIRPAPSVSRRFRWPGSGSVRPRARRASSAAAWPPPGPHQGVESMAGRCKRGTAHRSARLHPLP